MSVLKFKFDGNLDYQRRAIDSVVGLFEGQPLANATYSVSIGSSEWGSQLALGEGEFSNIAAVANQLALTDDLLLKSLQKIQEENNLTKQSELAWLYCARTTTTRPRPSGDTVTTRTISRKVYSWCNHSAQKDGKSA